MENTFGQIKDRVSDFYVRLLPLRHCYFTFTFKTKLSFFFFLFNLESGLFSFFIILEVVKVLFNKIKLSCVDQTIWKRGKNFLLSTC